MARGLRNKNPLNIRKDGKHWSVTYVKDIILI